jgi:hypothetical protein
MLNKKFLIINVLIISFILFSGCTDNNDTVTGPEINNSSVSLTTNVKNSAIYFNLANKKEVVLPDINIVKVTTQYSSYPEFKIYSGKIGNENIKIALTNYTSINDITETNYNTLNLTTDTTIGKNWYDYNVTTHSLTPKPNVYLLKNTQGNYVKFIISSYKDNKLTFVYSILYQDSTKFSKIDSVTVDFPNTNNYLSFQKGKISDIANWDIKFTNFGVQTPFGIMKYPAILLNSPAGVKATYIDNVDYNTISINQYYNNLVSDQDTTYAIGDKCLKYDENTHILNPYDKRVFIVKSYNGTLYKMKILNYYNNLGKSGYFTFEYSK